MQESTSDGQTITLPTDVCQWHVQTLASYPQNVRTAVYVEKDERDHMQVTTHELQLVLHMKGPLDEVGACTTLLQSVVASQWWTSVQLHDSGFHE